MTNHLNGVQFSSLFDEASILCQTKLTDRNEILMELLRTLAFNYGIGNVDNAYKAVIEREKESTTIIAPSIAVPHARLESIDKLLIAIATSREGINYTPGEQQPVKLIILILVPKASPGAYLQALSSLAKICHDPASPDRLAELKTPAEIWKYFDRGGIILPELVRASDIMQPVTVSLSEHDTMQTAIDLFVRHNLRELPVLDRDGDLVGVVTIHELLRICLPDYILWIEDLTPIINFEPFAEILRKESQTWLTEIMTSEYATIYEDAPAIQVAKELTRHNTDWVYVVRDKKLVGMVSLCEFLSKILRD